jgi:hypothetical protein
MLTHPSPPPPRPPPPGGLRACSTFPRACHRAQPLEVFVSRYWWSRYATTSVPGPITNADVLCDHGCLKVPLAEKAAELLVALTQRQYEALAAAYGAAEPPLRSVAGCHHCQEEAMLLQQRRRLESSSITAVDSAVLPEGDGAVWYLMSEWWLSRWRAFINNQGPHGAWGWHSVCVCVSVCDPLPLLPHPGSHHPSRLRDRCGLALRFHHTVFYAPPPPPGEPPLATAPAATTPPGGPPPSP